MVHAKATYPRIFPWNNDRDPEQIDRAQNIGGDLTLNQTKLYEIGRIDKLGVHKETPSFAYSLTQLENGSMAFWRDLANVEDPASGALDESIDLDDISSTYFDITSYLVDDDATFRGTAWFPKLRVNGFSMSIGDPDAIIERNFDLVGEDYKILPSKYFSFEKGTAGAPGAFQVTLSPIATEWASGDYIYRVLRVRSGVVTELLEDAGLGANTWAYNSGTHVVKVQTCLVGDIVKVYYPSATAYTTLWTDNDVDAEAFFADQCSIYLKVGIGANQRIYRLQSVNIDVSFDRADYKEVGNTEIVQTGVNAKTVTVTLGRILEDFTIEEILAGSPAYDHIDAREFSSDITLTVKIYTDNTKATFAMGYKITGLSPTTLNHGETIEEYDTADNALESDNFMATPDESEL
jgi:hypothetical protein